LGAKGVGRPRGCAPCWEGHTNKSPIHACPRHGSWATFIRLSRKGEKRVSDASKLGLVS